MGQYLKTEQFIIWKGLGSIQMEKRKGTYMWTLKKPRRARIIEKTFSESGEVTGHFLKKAKRLPQQNDPTTLEWLEKK